MHDPFDRRIGISGVALVRGRMNNSFKTWDKIDDFLTEFLKKKGYFQTEKFLYAQLIYRYGTKNNLKVEFGRIGKQYGELPIAVELDMAILQWADKHNLDLMHDIFMIAALEALIQVCEKYKLPKDIIVDERQKYGDIPNTIEECEAYQRKTLH